MLSRAPSDAGQGRQRRQGWAALLPDSHTGEAAIAKTKGPGPDDNIGVAPEPTTEDKKTKAKNRLVDSHITLQINGHPLKIKNTRVDDNPTTADHSDITITVATDDLADAAPADRAEGQPNDDG